MSVDVKVTEVHRFEVKGEHICVNSIDGDAFNVKVQILDSAPCIMPLVEFLRVADKLRQFDKSIPAGPVMR